MCFFNLTFIYFQVFCYKLQERWCIGPEAGSLNTWAYSSKTDQQPTGNFLIINYLNPIQYCALIRNTNLLQKYELFLISAHCSLLVPGQVFWKKNAFKTPRSRIMRFYFQHNIPHIRKTIFIVFFGFIFK